FERWSSSVGSSSPVIASSTPACRPTRSARNQPLPSWPGLSHGCPARFLSVFRHQTVLVSWQAKHPLTWAFEGFGWRSVELVEAPGMHDVELNKPGKAQRTADGGLQSLRHAQQQKSDQGDGHLDADCVVGGAEEAGDLQCLLDPAEEQLDAPAALVEIRDLLGGGLEIVGQDPQHLAGFDPHPHL